MATPKLGRRHTKTRRDVTDMSLSSSLTSLSPPLRWGAISDSASRVAGIIAGQGGICTVLGIQRILHLLWGLNEDSAVAKLGAPFGGCLSVPPLRYPPRCPRESIQGAAPVWLTFFKAERHICGGNTFASGEVKAGYDTLYGVQYKRMYWRADLGTLVKQKNRTIVVRSRN